LILILPAVATLPIGVLCFRSCLEDNQGYVIIHKMHTKSYIELHSGREVSATWAVVITREGEVPPIILQCSRDAFESLKVGDRPEVVTITNKGGARVRRLGIDADAGWCPSVYVRWPDGCDRELDPRNGD
jgi:hypothetical protein